MISLSLIICLFGVKMYTTSLGHIGFLFGSVAAYSVISVFLEIERNIDEYLWIAVGVCCVAGITCCIL